MGPDLSEVSGISANRRLTIQHLLNITLLTIFAVGVNSQEHREHQGPKTCGGRLKGPKGVIQTPNFPNSFTVPIKCRWIIEHDIVNGTISIYFTQQYTTSGLTFTEYMYYDDSYKLGERRALTLTEENITRVKWLQVTSPVLVVELSLERLEGTQLRALGLLNVFGFNVTYAVRAPSEEPQDGGSCSAIECRLLGHCYASHDYRQFFCSCLEGYSGADCGVGPLCPRASNMCRNGGTCRQMGPAAVSCICAPGYTGDLCEAQLVDPKCGIEECGGCNCDCNPKDSDVSTARFDIRLQIADPPSINNISHGIKNQLTNYLKASNITLEDEIEVINLSQPESKARSVQIRVWAPRREAGALRAVLSKMASRPRPGTLSFLNAPLQFEMYPALNLHSLIVNQRPEVWEGSEFILSCMAYGSPDIVFTWYKDGIKVNFNCTIRDIWTRTVAEDALGRRMSVLGVSDAKKPDGGQWACAAEDSGRRRCRALRLAVLRPPDIRLMPSALTINKGDNVSITCLAGAGRVHGALGFSWARERTLLPLNPGREVWEDLYPAGSVLKLYNVQKSSEFRCQVSSVVGTNAKSVMMWILGPQDEVCPAEASHGLRWPKTAPGAHAAAACPPGESGETTRFCEPKTGPHGVKWMSADFSGCVADSLKDIYEQFTLISYGYSWGSVWSVAQNYGAVLRSLSLRPGAGAIPLQHSRDMLQYLLVAGTVSDRIHSVEHLLHIYDTLLRHPDTFLDEEKIYELQTAVVKTAGMKDFLDMRLEEFTVKSKPAREDHEAHFTLPATATDQEEWILGSVGVELLAKNGNASIVVVHYHNLAARLPSLRKSIENKRCGKLEHAPASQQYQVWASEGTDTTLLHSVTLLFAHANNYTVVGSKLACGLRTASDPRTWTTKACEVRASETTHVACRCKGLGTYALFTVAISTLSVSEKDLRSIVKITGGLSGAMCLAASALQMLALMPGRKAKLSVLLKAATAGTHSAAMLALLECDTMQDKACPGPLGWVCAVCWCVGCAALCAQPLLLHEELAGRKQGKASVALLAGVCTLAWLTARVSGGAPLQLGAAAQAVCAAGSALLTTLCLALCMCAAVRLRTVTCKVPKERRNYFQDRALVIRHTMLLVCSSSAAQAAGVAYAQPGERSLAVVIALSIAATANGLAMLICYVARDEECLQSVRRILSLPSREWHDSPDGETSLSLYIKQGSEGAALEASSSHVSPLTSYWRASPLQSPEHAHRRLSAPDSRADIVRSVEYADPLSRGPRYCPASPPVLVCDLIPHSPSTHDSLQLQLAVLPPSTSSHTDHTPSSAGSLLTCSVHFEPYERQFHTFDTPKESCTICVQSNPDVSKVPIKSCLKKTPKDFSSSISLPSIEVIKDESKTKSDIEQVNREWKRAYDVSPKTDKILNKISSDLDFLLNRTESHKNTLDQIEEAPT